MEVVSIVLHQWKLSVLYYINGSCQYCITSMEVVSIVLHQWTLSLLYDINGSQHYCTSSMEAIIIVLHQWKQSLSYYINESNHYCTPSMQAVMIVLHQWKQSLFYYINRSHHYCTTLMEAIIIALHQLKLLWHMPHDIILLATPKNSNNYQLLFEQPSSGYFHATPCISSDLWSPSHDLLASPSLLTVTSHQRSVGINASSSCSSCLHS